MPFTETEETVLRAMIAEWQQAKDNQVQPLLDQKQTAEGQLRGLQPYLSAEKASVVEALLAPAEIGVAMLKG